ncbi:hypothetical protein QRX60_29220 [Amycolatopsis mongoliensis]|uniref:Secreted protein n=1 Tax=Amycolatopsis mongoliensis TaxID=715475 RepID=A0A9Y2JIS5_9PSEU|nr:hypothetical protein [Amycolatopsis sp. 4-36]WIX98146.1 hypothetical protein QRX60_29220 [Amycolatopsis sp. 4-36]
MMLMLLMECLLSGAAQDAMPTPALSTVTPSNDAMDGARFLMRSFWTLLSSPMSNSRAEFAPAHHLPIQAARGLGWCPRLLSVVVIT